MNDLSPREKVNALQAEMAKLPQIEPPTNHYFAKGMYAREMLASAGTVIVGKIHKQEHLFILTKGVISIGGQKPIEAPSVVVSPAGTKRAIFVLEDAVFMNVHITDKTDLDEIEAELIESEKLLLFDAGNKLKELPCLG